jgi:hypothetical protein
VALASSARNVFEPLGNDEHLAWLKNDEPISEGYFELAFQHDERFVGALVLVPHEFALHLDHLELVVVHFGDHSW